ncbi:MAG TPA: hypothetical protein VFM19_05305 [Candidatus Limnocylindria bacterium]|nr:hypothetical protein [Candidatus Limnocylindria bacterium]
MTMDHLQHPDDERLAAFAAGDGYPELAAHVSACDRCAPLVSDLRVLRASLAALPDLVPSRRLQFIPPVEPEPATAAGFSGLVRRLFAPAMVAGAALVLVGSVGMAATPALPASSDLWAIDQGAPAGAEGGPSAYTGLEAPTDGAAEVYSAGASVAADRGSVGDGTSPPAVATTDDEDEPGSVEALGSQGSQTPWLAMTIAGGILLIATLVLRWTVVPRAPHPPAYPGA